MSQITADNATNSDIETSPRRFTIYFQDDAVRRRSEETVQQLISSAMDNSTSSNSVVLAKKALKYRKLYERMAGVDMNSPEFDVSTFLGLAWCKMSSLEEYCKRQQDAADSQASSSAGKEVLPGALLL